MTIVFFNKKMVKILCLYGKRHIIKVTKMGIFKYTNGN